MGDYAIVLSVPHVEVDQDGALGRGIGARNGWSDQEFIKAAEKQLGLKIERRVVSGEMVVIDHLDTTPIPN